MSTKSQASLGVLKGQQVRLGLLLLSAVGSGLAHPLLGWSWLITLKEVEAYGDGSHLPNTLKTP